MLLHNLLTTVDESKKGDQDVGDLSKDHIKMSLKERAAHAVELDQRDQIHQGPRGGLYRLDANGKKTYLKRTTSPTGQPRRARRRRNNSSRAA